jgi:SAM-dependent methyltransferase
VLIWVDAMHKWNPEVYEKSSSTQKKWAEEVISKIQIKGNERVLDIGCGDGKITAYIASLVPEGSVVGIDNSAEMISFAQSKFPNQICLTSPSNMGMPLIYDMRMSSTLSSLSLVFTGFWITSLFLKGSNAALNWMDGFLFSSEAKEMLAESWKS